MSDNPFLPPPVGGGKRGQDEKPSVSEVAAGYNLVTDVVTGVNVRRSDNRFQAVFVAVSMAVFGVGGAVLAALNPAWNLPWLFGGLMGSFAGMVFGIFASGIYLMVYRIVRHAQGKHD